MLRVLLNTQKTVLLQWVKDNLWNERLREKTNNVDSDQVWQKPDCAATEDG